VGNQYVEAAADDHARPLREQMSTLRSVRVGSNLLGRASCLLRYCHACIGTLNRWLFALGTFLLLRNPRSPSRGMRTVGLPLRRDRASHPHSQLQLQLQLQESSFCCPMAAQFPCGNPRAAQDSSAAQP